MNLEQKTEEQIRQELAPLCKNDGEKMRYHSEAKTLKGDKQILTKFYICRNCGRGNSVTKTIPNLQYQ